MCECEKEQCLLCLHLGCFKYTGMACLLAYCCTSALNQLKELIINIKMQFKITKQADSKVEVVKIDTTDT